jgi:hypothetical protein
MDPDTLGVQSGESNQVQWFRFKRVESAYFDFLEEIRLDQG